MNKFELLLNAMLTKHPFKGLEKKSAKLLASNSDVSANYAETRIRRDKSANALTKRKYKFPK